MARNAATDAASALRLLNSEDLRQQPATGPSPRRNASATPGTPLNLGVVDYLTKAVSEIVDHTMTVTAQPKPLPDRLEDFYDWCLESTGNASDTQRRFREALFETHRLEHAIRLGEKDVVRQYPCPACGGWSLFWDSKGNRAWCSDLDCRTPDGLTRTFTLARLAAQQVQQTEIWRRNAT